LDGPEHGVAKMMKNMAALPGGELGNPAWRRKV
jgi:hypothetical protein